MAWTPEYDGASLASNQDIIVVSFNYRTNVFGISESPDLPLIGSDLGYLDHGPYRSNPPDILQIF
jgi:carboxylesterase type B